MRPGERLGDLVAITGELRSGDKVVVKPPSDFASGTLTKPMPK